MGNLRAAVAMATNGDPMDDEHSCRNFLMFFEEIGLAVENGLAHEEYLKQYFGSIVKAVCTGLAKVLDDPPGAYPHVRALRNRWEELPAPVVVGAIGGY